MAETGDRNDPTQAFRFSVTMNDLTVAGFSECRGLEIEIEMKDYVEGGLNDHVHKLPTRAKPANITLKRGIVDRAIWDWCWDTVQGRIVHRDGSVAIHPPDGGEPAMVFEFRRALPAKWSGPELDAGQSQVAMETLELVVHGLERVT